MDPISAWAAEQGFDAFAALCALALVILVALCWGAAVSFGREQR